MSKMSEMHAAMVEANGGIDPHMPDDSDWDAPPTVRKGQSVRAYLPTGNYCRGWVEAVEAARIGVRLVNGNFRWCRPADVKPDPALDHAGPWGVSDANR